MRDTAPESFPCSTPLQVLQEADGAQGVPLCVSNAGSVLNTCSTSLSLHTCAPMDRRAQAELMSLHGP